MTERERDYYEELGIPRDADKQAIKDAYHRLAMRWHPDRNKSPEAEARFKRIATAYAILSDPKKRAKYDARGFEGVAHFSQDDLFGGLDLGSLFGDLGFGFGPGGESIFDRFFHHNRKTQKAQDIHINIEVPLETIQHGGIQQIRFFHSKICHHCRGYGTADGRPPPRCPECGGSGHKVIQSNHQEERHTIRVQKIVTCPRCRGQGTLPGETCPVCHGEGRIAEPTTLRIEIPKGVEDGISLRIPGHGKSGDSLDMEPGDLFVKIYTKPNGRFQRRGADLWRSETLYPDEAALGTRRTVPTLNGDVEVTIPAGSQPDGVLRLRGKGLPRYGSAGYGDLNIRLQVQIPTTLSEREKALYRDLRAARK
jgi:molecular chaperone DnaJ